MSGGPPWEGPLARARALFARTYGGGDGARSLAVTAYAPGRVNLIGDHTDYQGGWALPIAVPFGAVAVARARADGWIGLVSEGRGGAVWLPAAHVRARKHRWDAEGEASGRTQGRARSHAPCDMVPMWAWFLAGVMAEAGALASGDGETARTHGLEVALACDVPSGAGLSSSAAAGLAVAAAATGATSEAAGSHQPWSGPRERLALCLACQRAEHRYLGVPSGLLDELAAAFGQTGRALCIDATASTAEPVSFAPEVDGASVFAINLGVARTLAASGYARRRAETEEAARRLGVATLRAVGVADLPQVLAVLPEPLGRRVRHVVTENARVHAAVAAAEARDWPAFGRLMWESHTSLREDYASSHPVLDRAVEALATADPPVYARITGGGFGGNLVALSLAQTEREMVARLRRIGLPREGKPVRRVWAGPGLTVHVDRDRV